MDLRRALPTLLLLAAVHALPAPRATGAPPAGEAGPSAGPVSVRVLYPPAGAILTSSPALVMILGPDAAEPPAFQLDGASLDVEKITFAEAWQTIPAKIPVPAGDDDLPLRSPLLDDKTGKVVWTAVETLSEGEHAITLEGTTLARFSSRAPRAGDGKTWDEPVLRVHGSPASPDEVRDCAQCHRVEAAGDPRVLGVAPVPETCHSCHAEVDLSLAHEHVMEFLAKCQTCHDPHAATRPRLLIDTRETVCSLCHESGHAR